ncbi:response regulator transcription factor [Clostridium chauvoei]|uniref:Stage 0 sporulation protein A homolog n=2 Tax=Clostridium chauvoei TaxID=46867 RepID=A0A1U6IXE8_9CLOT|nr:response regulator transcription factor [Clostridium chauvoei]ATD54176.1 DNA-binding response regulator [Clostridium chauvoei]ATD58144.1 DNA-binding response regulator [Clostridium chauvoei]MBX7281333.1 response regulator transcription factor [Clostridium chauvoei]MBX7283815.1 response regulator transcription factor [Clostridium chauvoei]MBX7288891.1 response regulator transcription factor [Clostridium chauvoei]
MYKVMLVDDEKLILQGLLNIIEWDKLDLKVIHSAEDGKEALEKFKETPVDIIVTDINMPRLTGLELLKEVKKLNNNVKFIILSGYDEFNYARTAIRLGVENYILKPIDEEELEATLKKLRNKIEEERSIDMRVLEKNSVLLQFINGKISKDELSHMKDSINIGLDEKSYIVSSINVNNRDTNENNNIYEILEEITEGKYEVLYKFDGHIILINTWNRDVNKEEILKYYNKVREKLSNELNADVFIAIGEKVDSIEKLEESYRVSNNLKKYVLTEGFNICLSKEDVWNLEKENRSFHDEIETINKLVIEKNKPELEKYILSLFDQKLTPRNIYDLSIKTIFLMDKVSEEFRLDVKYRKDSLRDTLVKLCNESAIDNIKSFILGEIDELMELMTSNTVKYSPVVQQVVNTVNEKYCEELSLKTLAHYYNINSSYLGQIFTKEVGSSFSDYLNKVKNMKAKELILNTNMKINDIAKAVGYFDTSYFYRKFKKYYGVCPSTLREMKNY